MGMLISICFLLSACSEREEFESLVNRGIEEEEEVDVHLSLSSIPAISIEGDTDYRPMNTRAEGEIRSIIDNTYNCLVMKEIDSKWYVDTLLQQTLTSGGQWATIKVKEGMDFKDIQLTLRPGHYRVLAVLNPSSTYWNPDLVPGALVKGSQVNDTVAYAYTYFFQPLSSHHSNKGERQVLKEIFAGTTEFTVEKTSKVDLPPVNGNTHITLFRKVMQFRFLLKDYVTEKNEFNFIETQYTVKATLKTVGKEYFCDGLNCFGQPYYIQGGQTTKMKICTDLTGRWRKGENKGQYLITSYHATIHSPFIFADDNLTVPFQIDSVTISGQSTGPLHIYSQTITDLKVNNDTIQQIVFQNTDSIIEGERDKIILEYLKDESALQLFGPYYECNIP